VSQPVRARAAGRKPHSRKLRSSKGLSLCVRLLASRKEKDKREGLGGSSLKMGPENQFKKVLGREISIEGDVNVLHFLIIL